MRAAVAGLAVALLVVVAGCNAVPGDGGPSGTATSADLPDDRPEDYPYPPGVAANGTLDTERLIRAHQSEVSDVAHTMTYRVRVRRGSGENRTTTFDWNRTVWYENASVYRSAEAYESTGERAGAAETGVYANGSVEFTRSARPTETLYLSDRPTDRPPAVGLVTSALDRYLPPQNVTVERVVRGQQGYTVIRADRFDRTSNRTANESLELVVRPSGLVVSLTATYTEHETGSGPGNETGSEQPSNVTVQIEYDDLGETTATPPEWLPEARADIDNTPPVVITEFVVTTNTPRPTENATTASTPPTASTPTSTPTPERSRDD